MSSTLFPSLVTRTAIVTGASRGIGRAIAVELARQGLQVMLAARNAELLAVAVAEIRAAGGTAESTVVDLREPEAPAHLVKQTVAAFGGIDVVVNNAGATKRGNFLKLTEEDWADGFALKFFGTVRLIRAAWPYLKERNGSVVNIAGVGGRTPGAEFAIGGSVNAALLSLTKALADAGIADGIQVNAINPGPVRTERLQGRLEALAAQRDIDLGSAEAALQQQMEVARFGEPQDIADLVSFMVSSKGRFFHGSLVDMDGGQTKTL